MTIKQKQCLLAYLGYYTGSIDGLWGTQSMTATEAFQDAYGIGADGIFGPATEKKILEVIASGEQPIQQPQSTPETGSGEDWWKDIQYFNREEFRCKCGGKYCNGFPVEPEESLVRTLDKIREKLGMPITINSGIRCATHNANEGGVANSQHLYGRAADLHSNASPARMKGVAEEVLGSTGGIGLYSWGIHVDTWKYSRWNG